jgi:hypothetical protein
MDFNKDGKTNDILIATAKGVYSHSIMEYIPEIPVPLLSITATAVACIAILRRKNKDLDSCQLYTDIVTGKSSSLDQESREQ